MYIDYFLYIFVQYNLFEYTYSMHFVYRYSNVKIAIPIFLLLPVLNLLPKNRVLYIFILQW